MNIIEIVYELIKRTFSGNNLMFKQTSLRQRRHLRHNSFILSQQTIDDFNFFF